MPKVIETSITTQTHRLAARIGGVAISVIVVQSEDGDADLAADIHSAALNSISDLLVAESIVPQTWNDTTDVHTELRREQRRSVYAIDEPYAAAFAAANLDPEEWSHVA